MILHWGGIPTQFGVFYLNSPYLLVQNFMLSILFPCLCEVPESAKGWFYAAISYLCSLSFPTEISYTNEVSNITFLI